VHALIQINGLALDNRYERHRCFRDGGRYLFRSVDLYMMGPSNETREVKNRARTPRDEFLVFIVIVALIWPALTVGVVGGYGFAVWMYQLVAGPPGPPKR
jgi:periplasmic nitrate reductase NapE